MGNTSQSQTQCAATTVEQETYRLPISEWLIASLNLVRESDMVPFDTAKCDVPLLKRTLQLTNGVKLLVTARVLSTHTHSNVREEDILDSWHYASCIAKKTQAVVQRLRKPNDLSQTNPERICERLEPSTHTMKRVRVSNAEVWLIDTTVEVKSI